MNIDEQKTGRDWIANLLMGRKGILMESAYELADEILAQLAKVKKALEADQKEVEAIKAEARKEVVDFVQDGGYLMGLNWDAKVEEWLGKPRKISGE